MSDIRLEVLHDILLRLPAPSLFRFKTVCKEWRRLIDDPSFIRSHAANEDSSTTLCITTSARASVYYLPLDSLEYADGLQIINANRVRTSIPSLPMASCNGLELVSYYDAVGVFHQEIWNLLTGDFHKLPRLDYDGLFSGGWVGDDYAVAASSGLGYDCAADDYKVVRIDRVHRESSSCVLETQETRVYSLKLGSWKAIKGCPDDIYETGAGVFLDGSLHWLSKKGTIIALDLRTEDYREFPEPPVGRLNRGRLDALCGSLVFSCFSSRNCYEGWLMEGYGSWMKLFSFGDVDVNFVSAARNMKPMAYLKSKGQIILQEGCNGCKEVVFHWLDIANNTWKKFTIQGLPKFINSHICPGSLFRLDQTPHLKRKNVARLKCFVTVTDTCFHSDSSSSSDSDLSD